MSAMRSNRTYLYIELALEHLYVEESSKIGNSKAKGIEDQVNWKLSEIDDEKSSSWAILSIVIFNECKTVFAAIDSLKLF